MISMVGVHRSPLALRGETQTRLPIAILADSLRFESSGQLLPHFVAMAPQHRHNVVVS